MDERTKERTKKCLSVSTFSLLHELQKGPSEKMQQMR